MKKGLAVGLRTVLFWVKNEFFRLFLLMTKNIVDLTKSNHRYAVIFWEMLRKCVYFVFRCVLSETFFRDKCSQDLWKIMLLLFSRDFICRILTFNANYVQASLVMLWFDKTRERHANLRTPLAPVKSSWKNRQEITPSIHRYRFNGENFVIGSQNSLNK